MTWLVNLGSAGSRLLNAILGGRPTQTLSARMHNSRQDGCTVCGWVCDLLSLILREEDHCAAAADFDCSQAARELAKR